MAVKSRAKQVKPGLLIRGLSGAVLGRSWVVGPSQSVILGRAVVSEPNVISISIPDPRISSLHCRIELKDGAYRAMDLKSLNGVLINGNRIASGIPEELRDGDILTVAELVLEVRILKTTHVNVQESGKNTRNQTVAYGENGQEAPALVLDLMPSPLAISIRKVRHTVSSADLVQETLRSFEVILRFQTLVELSEYLAQGIPDEQVQTLLAAFCTRPFSLGRWLELHVALSRAIAGDKQLVVEELGSFSEGDDARRWKASAARLVELRNSLVHNDGMGQGSVESVAPGMTLLFNEILSRLAFWVGYRFIAVEPGTWSDREGLFLYPCRILLGCASPFEVRVLPCASALPPRVPMVVSRDGKRRLSLGPMQAILPGSDSQLNWFWLSEGSPERMTLTTYPANFRTVSPASEAIKKLLSGEDLPSQARAEFRANMASP